MELNESNERLIEFSKKNANGKLIQPTQPATEHVTRLGKDACVNKQDKGCECVSIRDYKKRVEIEQGGDRPSKDKDQGHKRAQNGKKGKEGKQIKLTKARIQVRRMHNTQMRKQDRSFCSTPTGRDDGEMIGW